MLFTKASLFLMGGFFVLLLACSETDSGESVLLKPTQLRGEAQGTTYNIIYYSESADSLNYEIDSVLRKIDNSLSNWVPSSIISAINSSDEPALFVQDTFMMFYEMMEQSKYFYDLSEGAFDPTVMPLVSAWGFGLKNRQAMDSSKVDSLLTFVGMTVENIQVEISEGPNSLLLRKKEGVQLDFNAIAQGYSVDLIAEYLQAKGIKTYMIELGGEVRVGNAKPNNSQWKVGIDKPIEPEKGRELQTILELSNASIATSGNYRKFYEKDGMRYSHTINPKTGFPVNHNLLSATVITESAAKADAIATICMVIGLEESKKLFDSMQDELQLYLIYQDKEGQIRVYEN